MLERLLRRCGHHYILVMMLPTIGLGSAGGLLGLYYVHLSTDLPARLEQHFTVAGIVLVSLAVVMTVPVALWNTRTLRSVLRRLQRPETVPSAEGRRAGREAVLFASRQQICEAVQVPLCSVVPMCFYLRLWYGAPGYVLLQIAIAGFLAVAAVLLVTFFVSERWMTPLVRYLLEKGIEIDFAALPASRLQVRMNLCVSLTIVVTAVMIGSLANQRAQDIMRYPDREEEIIADLRQHTVYITLAATGIGLLVSHILCKSVSSRVNEIVAVMKRVQDGDLSERLEPTNTDEIEQLARQFNAMVEELDRNNRTIRDLNTNLEQRVKHRTHQLSQSRRSLQQSLQKLKEYDRLKTEFFSNVSHELRTPLTMILSPVDRILQTHAERVLPEVRSLLEVTRLNGQRLLRLINQLLDFSKLEAGRTELRPGAVDLNRLVRRLTAAADSLLQQREIHLELDLDSTVPVFGADEEKVDTILSNLLSNAIKFTPVGGTVSIRTRRLCDRVEASVSDTGIGIDEEDHGKIFERFVQVDGSTSREFSGTGLGLPLVKELVELHGGQIELDSKPGQGACFRFTLPLADVPEDAQTGPQERARENQGERFADLVVYDAAAKQSQSQGLRNASADHKVLVVDDTPEIRLMIGEILAENYDVLYAADGEEAARVVREQTPDLILSDVMMPRVDGYDLCRRLKDDPATAHIPFVLLTAKAGMSKKIEGLNCGADDYLVKPFDTEELRARVRSLLRLRSLYNELEERNSELHATLEELRATQKQLVHSEKMSSVGQLAAGLAHEINNAINGVYNGIQPLQAKTGQLHRLVNEAFATDGADSTSELSEQIEKSLTRIEKLTGVIESGAGRTVRLISDLKTFSHPGSETSEWFDLHQTLDTCLSLLENRLKDRIAVRRDYGTLEKVCGPFGQLNQVFMNLLSNAADAISGTGEITITTRQEGNRVTIGVRDTGDGIPEDVRPRIFDPFFTTKPPGVGTGLGLSLSYSIVTGIGGTLEFDSETGVGTEFVLTIPVRAENTGGDAGRDELAVAAT